MNARERLLRAVDGRPTDRPPFICPGGMMTMAVKEAMERLDCPWPEIHTDPMRMAGLTAGMVRIGGLENLGVPYCMTIEAEEMGAAVDLGNPTREPHVTGYALPSLADLHLLKPISPDRGRARVCCRAIQRLKNRETGMPIVGNVTGPVSLATSLVDPLLYYRALRRDPAAAHALNEICARAAVQFGEAMIAAGADLICIADPSATGELVGPAAFREFCLPYLNRISDHFQEKCFTPVIVHICGNIRTTGGLVGELTARGISVDSVVSIRKLKRLAAGKAAMGNVSTFLLEKGDTGKVRNAADVCLGQDVDILAPACGISPLTPLANIRALSAAAKARRREPSERE